MSGDEKSVRIGCRGISAATGLPCTTPPTKTGYCAGHNLKLMSPEEKAAHNRKAGQAPRPRARRLRTAVQVMEALEEAVEDFDDKQLNAMANACRVILAAQTLADEQAKARQAKIGNESPVILTETVKGDSQKATG